MVGFWFSWPAFASAAAPATSERGHGRRPLCHARVSAPRFSLGALTPRCVSRCRRSLPHPLSRVTVANQVCVRVRHEEVIVSSFNPNYFIHAANILLLVAYSVRDILWLRVFAVASSVIALPYFVLQPTPQWAP